MQMYFQSVDQIIKYKMTSPFGKYRKKNNES